MVVLDASVWVASLLTDEPMHAASDRWLHDWMSLGRRLTVPRLFVVEVGSAVARRRKSAPEGNLAVVRVQSEPLLEIREHDRQSWVNAAQYATHLQIRAADAVYVALAAHSGFPLVTWDQELLLRAGTTVDVRTPDQVPV